jgi:signal recognition particle GTPase
MDTSTLPAASVAEELFQLALGSGALPQLDRPLLLCMCGAPGAGKTTIARTLAASAPAHLECNMVRFDDVDAIIDLRTAAGEAAAEAFDGRRLAAARADALALVAKTLSTSRVTNCGRQSIVVVDDTMHHQVCHNQN